MAEQTQVGIILEGPAQRDAIHIAIAPVVAGEKLVPGAHVGFIKDGNTELVGVRTKETIGVVDPFYKGMISVGQRFYMFLYPQTITSLKHQWTHPAFKDEIPQYVKPKRAADVEASEKWLKNWLSNNDAPSYELVMKVVGGPTDGSLEDDYYGGSIDSEYFNSYGQDAYGEIPDEFWDHIAVVTGKEPEYRPKRFSCSC